MKKKHKDYSLIKFEKPDVFEPERKIIIVKPTLDSSVFVKSPEEKRRLKEAKRKLKQYWRSMRRGRNLDLINLLYLISGLIQNL